jgi:hypothetical protein
MRQVSRKSRKVRHRPGRRILLIDTDSWQSDKTGQERRTGGGRQSLKYQKLPTQARGPGRVDVWAHVRGPSSLIVKDTAKQRRQRLASSSPSPRPHAHAKYSSGPAEALDYCTRTHALVWSSSWLLPMLTGSIGLWRAD